MLGLCLYSIFLYICFINTFSTFGKTKIYKNLLNCGIFCIEKPLSSNNNSFCINSLKIVLFYYYYYYYLLSIVLEILGKN